MQLNPLMVKDPLEEKKVIINIQVNDDHETRSQRSVLVTAGISGQVPVILAGNYGQLHELINQAWQQFGQNQKGASSTNNSGSTTIAQVSVKPAKKQSKPNKESILSLF